jgi:hypothetical protein
MTLRKIVNDIRTHAADHLAAAGLAPMVRIAADDAVSDVIVFQTKGGNEHVVAVIVPKDAGADAWIRSAVAPLSIRTEAVEGTPWHLVHADGVALDDVVGLRDLSGDEERVAMIVEHLERHAGRFTPRDDLAMNVFTDPRIFEIAEKLKQVALFAEGDFILRIGGDELSTGEAVVDSVSVQMDDGRYIDVVLLSDDSIRITTTGEGPWSSQDVKVDDISVFEKAMDQLAAKYAESRESAEFAY